MLKRQVAYIATYKPFELKGGHTMWQLVQVEVAYPHMRPAVPITRRLGHLNNHFAKEDIIEQNGGLWQALLVASPKPPRFMFRDELKIWP